MNACLEAQISGSQWRDRLAVQAFPVKQASPRPQAGHPGALFESLEQQMVEYRGRQEAIQEELRRHYVLPADRSVQDFLSQHQSIPALLLEAVPHLKRHFGANAIFSLSAPIDEAGTRTLHAVAIWPGGANDAREALSGFDNDWWMAHARQASGDLTFTYELV